MRVDVDRELEDRESEESLWALLEERQPLLYEESTEPAVLRRLLDQVLLQLTLVPVSQAARIGGNEIARLKPESGPPRRTDDETAPFLRDFERARTNAQRLAVIKAAQERLTALRFAPARDEIGLRRGTLDFKIAVAVDPRATHVVAQVYGVAEKTVRRYRRRFRGTEPQDGS